MSLYSDVRNLIRGHALLEDVRTLVVAVSGGADSVCLCDLLVRMVERGDVAASLHVAHLNHALRGAESDADERFARKLAEARGLPITVERRDVAARRAEGGGSLEAIARHERYAFLAAVAQDTGAEAVAVGHNADDQAETILHHLLRGAGLRGLRGMPLARPLAPGSAVRLLRPLLRTRRGQILDWLAREALPFREDASNRDETLLRNRIRHRLLPLLESEYSPGVREALLRLAGAAADAYHFLVDAADAVAPGCVSGTALDLERFRHVPNALRPLLIDRAVAAADPRAPQLAAAHYEAVMELTHERTTGAQAPLPGGLVAVRERGRIRVERPSPEGPAVDAAPALCVPIAVPGDTHAPGVTVRTTVHDHEGFDLGAFTATKSRDEEALDADALLGPLELRPRREGDRFQPLGCPGRKKIGDFLTDAKVPQQERKRVLVVTAGGEPIWVVGHRIDERVKVTPTTRQVLILSVQRTEDV